MVGNRSKITSSNCAIACLTMQPKIIKVSDASATMEFEGESPIVTEEEVLSILSKKLSRDFDMVKYNLRPLNSTNGFLGLYYELTALVKIDEAATEHKFFLKTQPLKHSPQYEFLVEANHFQKELTMYGKIIPRMKTGKNQASWSAECYLARDDLIVMDDLSALQYAMPDKYAPFDYNHCAVLLQTLARLHSGFFVIEDKLKSEGKTLFEVYGHVLDEPLFNGSDISRRYRASCVLGTRSLIDLLRDELTEEQRAEFKERVEPWCDNFPAILSPSTKYRNVICHRDLWANNMMLKYDESGNPQHCCLIDLQFARYGTPAIDCVISLHLITDRETRDKHGESLLRVYHRTFEEELRNAGLDARDCLEWSTFLKSCEETKPTALVYAILNQPVTMLDPDTCSEQFIESPELLNESLYNDRSALVCGQFLSVQPYRERITEALLEAYELLPNYVASQL
ncbi:uncharacterized protein LOC124310489 [Neodiprion virginianus]|uniref:uncharacterized protein LOC124310489 n=1 Tax=Neodiprion virginianus TaxID=2961670 RepID=UPI001EE6D648|nr:uncharacterized protein LOC124310489 [Neodiprion virginianus]